MSYREPSSRRNLTALRQGVSLLFAIPILGMGSGCDPSTPVVSPTVLEFRGQTGGPNPFRQAVTISNPGVTSVDWEARTDVSWIQISPDEGELEDGSEQELEVTISVSGLPVGPAQGTIEIDGGDAGTYRVDVSLTVVEPATITLLGTLNPRPLDPDHEIYNGIWGYAAGGHEYALLGSGQGLSVIDVTNPSAPAEHQFIPMAGGETHRDVVTWGHYAYVGGQEGADLYVIDLAPLPSGAATVVNVFSFYRDAVHTIHAEDGLLFLNSADEDGWEGVRILDLLSPESPIEIAHYTGSAAHDVDVKDGFMFSSGGNEGTFDVVDIRDPNNPTRLGVTDSVFRSYAHSCAISEDGRTLYACEEFDVEDVLVYDVSNPRDPTLLSTVGFAGDPLAPASSRTPVHNPKVRGSFLHLAYYRKGYVLLDVHDPSQPYIRGQFAPLSPPGDEQFTNAFGLYVDLPSGNVIVSDTRDGLLVFQVDVPLRAHAGLGQRVGLGRSVSLDGRGSDITGQVSFSWGQTSGVPVTLTGANTPLPSFTPQMAGDYTFELTVTNAQGLVSSDSVLVTVDP